MCKVYQSLGRLIIHVEVAGKDCECPVTLRHDGIGLIDAPIDHAIRRDLLEMPGLLQIVRSYEPRIKNLKISES